PEREHRWTLDHAFCSASSIGPAATEIASMLYKFPRVFTLFRYCRREVNMSQVSRRVLTAFLPIFLCLPPGSKAGAAPVDLTVMTQNHYVGADADDVLGNPTPDTNASAFRSIVANNL